MRLLRVGNPALFFAEGHSTKIVWLLSLEKIGKEIAYKDYIPNVILVDDDEEEEEDISNAENYI